MTPYTRRMIAAGAAALAIAGTGYATHPAEARSPRTPAQIAPGGNVTSVLYATRHEGWPHPPGAQEMRDTADLALFWGSASLTIPGRVSCAFGPAMGRARCHGWSGRRNHHRPFDVVLKFWEDGSYRYIIPTN